MKKNKLFILSFCVCYLHMQMQTLCRAVEISITISYSTSVKIFYRGLTEVFMHCKSILRLSTRGTGIICRESVVNDDECCHSIVNYRKPYHWLPENYEFKTTFGTIVYRGDWLDSPANIKKEQTKKLRFMLEGPRPCTIFCFPLIHYA